MLNKKLQKFDTVIIGGGASGMVAAISLARGLIKENKNQEILILELHSKLGRKLLATGNGTCNLSNERLSSKKLNEVYFSSSPVLYETVITNCDLDRTLDFFSSLGIVTTSRDDGKIYPYSRRAKDVVDILEKEIDLLNISVKLNFEVTNLSKNKEDEFSIDGKLKYFDENKIEHFSDEKILAKKVILAAGGKASPNISSDGLGYFLATNLGHNLTRIFPSIAQLKTKSDINKKLSGLRWDVKITLLKQEIKNTRNSNTVIKDQGELLFTEYGISGPVSFNLARYIHSNENKKYQFVASIDFLPEYENQKFLDFIEKKKIIQNNLEASNIFMGLLPSNLAFALAKKALGSRINIKISQLQKTDLEHLILALKKYEMQITDTTGFSKAQVTAGGISCDEINPNTLESLKCKGLYICGEILDVDGICGGYNLQFAWSSGIVAAENVVKSL